MKHKLFKSVLLFVVCLFLIGVQQIKGQELKLVKDIFQGVDEVSSSYPNNFIYFKNKIFFIGNYKNFGRELLSIDTQTKEVTLVKDISNGHTFDNDKVEFTIFNDKLYFRANDKIHGEELWVSNGTEEGTLLLKDINEDVEEVDRGTYIKKNPLGSKLGNFFEFNGKLFFIAENEDHGKELWITDGSSENTKIFKEFIPGEESSFRSRWYFNPIIFNNEMYFTAETTAMGRELYKTNGTSEGTVLVKDIYTGVESGSPFGFVKYKNELYFSATTATNGKELWKTNGTEEGTVMVLDHLAGTTSGNPQYLTIFNDKLFAVVETNNNLGEELHVYDDENNTFNLVKDIYVGIRDSYIAPIEIINGYLLFYADTNEYRGELWKTDGTPEGTSLLKDINENGTGVFYRTMDNYLKVEDKLYFYASDNGQREGIELWVTDGTEIGTQKVKDVNSNNNDFNSGGNGKRLLEVENTIYFVGTNLESGVELWKTDGTEQGTTLFTNVGVIPNSSGVSYCTPCGDYLYFTGKSDTQSGLWKTDGTPEGTTFVKEMRFHYYQKGKMECINNKLYFSGAEAETYNYELWTSDGTEEGTLMIKDIRPGTSGSFPQYFVGYKNEVYFRARDGVNGIELWKTNGTPEGTVMVVDLYPDSSGVFGVSSNIVVFKDKLYFGGSNRVSGYKLFKSDGTAAGTELALNVGNDFYPRDLYATDNKLYFTGESDSQGREVWFTDGTSQSALILELNVGNGDSVSSHVDYIWFDNQIYFTASNGQGFEMWRFQESNNTPYNIARISISDMGSIPYEKISYHDRIFYTASNNLVGRELWYTKKGEDDAYGVKDFINGPSSPKIKNMVLFKDKLFFSAKTEDYGRELMYLDLSPKITTLVAENITTSEAKISLFINSDANEAITKVGFVLSKKEMNADPLLEGTHVQNIEMQSTGTVGAVNFTNLGSLEAGITYVYKGYAINEFGVSYGANIEFTTEDVTLNTDSHKLENQIKVFPNPITDFLEISLKNNISMQELTIYDINGRTVMKKKKQKTINMSSLTSGIYFLKVKTDKGEVNRKIVKE